MTGFENGYLLSCLLGLPGVALFLILSGRFRGSVWLAGAIELLHVPPLIHFQGVYWSPPRIGGLALGVEDALVCFSIGVGAWFFALWPSRGRLVLDIRPGPTLARLAMVALPSTAFAWIVWQLGAGVMEVLLLTMAAVFGLLAARRPAYLRLALPAVVFYTPYYLAVLFFTEALFPGFFLIWDGPELWGLSLAGLALEEVVFVATFAATYPMILAYAFRARLQA